MKEISHEKEVVTEECRNRENQIAELEENFHSIKQEIENLMSENQNLKEENNKKDKVIDYQTRSYLIFRTNSCSLKIEQITFKMN